VPKRRRKRRRAYIEPPKLSFRSLWDRTMRPTPCADIRLAISHAELLLRDARFTAPDEMAELEEALAAHQDEYTRRGCQPPLPRLYEW
jgi:hypothetical protein